jgi:CheY-like chemotaxis protein
MRGTTDEEKSRIIRGLDVLVVDDDLDAQEIYCRLLELYGARVTCAASAATAVEQIEAGYTYDVLLSDIAMPGRDGLWLVRQMRARRGRQVLAVAVSGSSTPRLESAAREAGFDAFLVKPVDVEALLAAVGECRRKSVPAAARPRVLVVDDDADSRDILTTILECEGADVSCVDSAVEALAQYVGAGGFDIVVSDLAMPKRDGLWLVRHLKRAAGDLGRPLHAVALSAHAQQETRDAALDAGFDVFVAKPFEVDELRAAVLGRKASGS